METQKYSGMEINLINNNYNQHRNKYQQEVLINEMNFNYLNSILCILYIGNGSVVLDFPLISNFNLSKVCIQSN